MNACTECGSFAINHHRHGRDGSDGHLCDVCYWRARAKSAICIGPPLISILAKDGQWTGSDGRGVVAADGLFQQDPYERIGQLERELNEANSGNWYGAGISIATELALAGRKPEDIVDAVKGLVRELNEAKQELASIYSSSEAEALAEANANSIRLLSMLDESHAREAQLRAALKLGIDATASTDIGDARRADVAARLALSLPPSPVIPVEDVKPLLQLLKEVAELDTGEQECIASDCAKALATFTAKHKHTL